MKIKNFSQFINEGMDNRSSLADLSNLYSLGIIDYLEYSKGAIEILKSLGVIDSYEPIVNVEDEADFIDDWQSFAESWTGPGGETIVSISGEVSETSADLNVELNTKMRVNISVVTGSYYTIDVVIVETHIGSDSFTDEFPDHITGYPTFQLALENILEQSIKQYSARAIGQLIEKL